MAQKSFGDLAVGTTSDYREVRLKLRYAALELKADGRRVTGQTPKMASKRFTYRIDAVDLEAGHPAIEVVRD